MQEIKIGLLGFGNVGMGVYKILEQNGTNIACHEGLDIKVGKILVRNINKRREVSVDSSLYTDNIEEIINNPEISIVAEFIGGVEPAKDYILKALRNKKTVVTANKELVARHWDELNKAAHENGVGLYFEASVAGGIPIIKVVGEALQANKVEEIMGIINGTTNYILTKMTEEGRSFDDVLKEAQRLGYAEPDPTADIEAYDAMFKLSILSSLCFHERIVIGDIHREGITSITTEDIAYGKELGFGLKLLAIAKKKDNKIQVRVHPTFIPVSHPLYAVRNSFNAIFLKGNAVGDLMFYGRGAGDLPTGSAILSDVISAAQSVNKHRYNISSSSGEIKIEDNWETEFFIRFTVKDQPGVLGKIAGIFGKYDVSIESVIQKGRNGVESPLIFVTHNAKEISVQNAINEIKKDDCVIRVENVIRVEQ